MNAENNSSIFISKERVGKAGLITRLYLSDILDNPKDLLRKLTNQFGSDISDVFARIKATTPVTNAINPNKKVELDKNSSIKIGVYTIESLPKDIVPAVQLIAPEKVAELLEEQKESAETSTTQVWNSLEELAIVIETDTLAESQNGDIFDLAGTHPAKIAKLISTHPNKKKLFTFLDKKHGVLDQDNDLSDLCVEYLIDYLLDELNNEDRSDENTFYELIKEGLDSFDDVDFGVTAYENYGNHRILRHLNQLITILEQEFSNFQKEYVSDYFITEPMKTKIEEIIKFSRELYFDDLKDFLATKSSTLKFDSLPRTFLANLANNINADEQSDSQFQRAINKSIFEGYRKLLHQNPPEMFPSEYTGCGNLDE